MEGKIIIVGATGYTGSALAKLLKKENIDCHLIGRNELELKKLATETNQSFSVCMDVSNEQSVEDSLKNVANDKILGFAYCVGSIVLKSFQTTKIDDFINTFNLNVAGAIHFIKKLFILTFGFSKAFVLTIKKSKKKVIFTITNIKSLY